MSYLVQYAARLPRTGASRLSPVQRPRIRLARHDERRFTMSYLERIRPRRPAQSEPIPGSGQVPNSAGGFAWAVDDWTRLRRFKSSASTPQRRS
ncbi:MAG: hypothetical protein ICV64_01665 [Thermoleophilia bacterium]|nr:hypothetical protein [Thermoleophilia bacterium]